ncbi:MAG: hypothetical protein AAB263_18890 [Planctomycetota bacterium]
MTDSAKTSWQHEAGALRFLAAKVARVHGPTHPDVATLATVVDALAVTKPSDTQALSTMGGRLRELTGEFKPWEGACGSVHQLFAGLKGIAQELPKG